jgi:lysophosphatidylcholine acyltransferase/lyso-PAF acetyltransferase
MSDFETTRALDEPTATEPDALATASELETPMNPFDSAYGLQRPGFFRRLFNILLLPLWPFRVILFFFFLFVSCPIWLLLNFGTDPRKPLARWRRAILHCESLFNIRLGLICLGFTSVKFVGMENALAPEAPIIVSNHISPIDILLMMAAVYPSYVSKSAVRKVPIVGLMATVIRTIFVRRTAEGGSNAAEKILERVTNGGSPGGSAKGAWPKLFMAPEGTTTNGHCLVHFHSGAFIAGVPVVPAVIRYSHRFINPSDADISDVSLILRLCTHWGHKAQVTFLPVYTPSLAERADPHLYARNVQALIAAELGVPCLPYQYIDKKAGWMAQGDFERCTPEWKANFGIDAVRPGCVRRAPKAALTAEEKKQS